MWKDLVTKSFTYDGKRYWVRGKTEKDCYEKMALKKRDLESGYFVFDESITVSKWVSEYLENYKRPSVSESWYKELVNISNNVILSEIGNMKMKSVKPINLQKILKAKSSCSRSYINKIYILIREIFRAAKSEQIIPVDPSENLVAPPGKKKTQRRPITPQERKTLLKVCESHRMGLFLKLQLYCGLRPGEAAVVKWSDIDMANGIINVNKALKKDDTIGDPKSSSGIREIPIPSSLISELNQIEHEPFDWVCKKVTGGHLTRQSIKRGWESVVYRMNIEMGCKTFKGGLVPPYPVAEDLVMYCLRHTYCTDLQAAGVPINVARELMGHSDISITAQIYTHGSKESFEDARNAIDNLEKRRSESTKTG